MLKVVYHKARNYRALNFFLRVCWATTYFNRRYLQILKWGFCSREDTNLTYDLTDSNLHYMAQMIAVAVQKPVNEIVRYMEEAQNDKSLSSFVIESTQKSKFRSRADLKCSFGRRLGWYAVARALRPRVIVETGVDKGLGAVLLCAALLKNKEEGHGGRYFGTDIDPEAGYLLSGPYKTVGEVLFGDSIMSLKSVKDPIDLFINDSDHSCDYEWREYQAIKDKITVQTIILSDNAHITDALERFSSEMKRRFIFFKEEPKDHWYPGAGIGISYTELQRESI